MFQFSRSFRAHMSIDSFLSIIDQSISLCLDSRFPLLKGDVFGMIPLFGFRKEIEDSE